jgi:hypothetical protein
MCIFHDWEVLKTEEVRKQTDDGYFKFRTVPMIKVCLKCGKVVDKIKEREERQKKARELKAKRQDWAKRIYRGEVKIK